MEQVLKQIKQPMVFHSNTLVKLVIFLLLPLCINSCLSYQILTQIDGAKVVLPSPPLKVGLTSLTDVLNQCGAPQKILSLNQHIALIYQRTVANSRRLALSLPFYYAMRGYDISANGGVSNRDTLVLVFTAQGTLEHYSYEQAAQDPFFKTLFQD